MTSTIKRGEIVLVDFNPVIGAEIQKTRPAVVVSRTVINQHSPFLVVLPLTTNTQKILPYHLLINPTKENKLDSPSKCLTEQIKCVDKKRYIRTIGTLSKELLEELNSKMDIVLREE